MDTEKENKEENSFIFDILRSDFQLVNTDEVDNKEIEAAGDISELLANVSTGEPVEKDRDFADFETNAGKQRFQVVTDEDLDRLEAENNAKATHWQTNWAVGVIKGSYIVLLL